MTLSGCEGEALGGPQGPGSEDLSDMDAGGAADGGESCAPTLASLQADVFSKQCATAGCHTGKSAAAALDLTRSDLARVLVSVSASSCDGHQLVVPGDPDASLLLTKMTGKLPAGCGEPMPPTGVTLPAEQLACVRGWIAGLSKVDTGADAGGPSSDAGGDAAQCETCGTASCIDLTSDPQHCGACTTSCGTGSTCSQGTCACGAGLQSCNGSCVETATDPNNCQGCNIKCSSTQLCTPTGCSSGGCGSLSQCGSACVDTETSLTHCGGCDKPCAAGQMCQSGSCVCPNGGSLCGGACVDTMSSAFNCGSCGKVCPNGTTCSAGACACPDGQTLCGNTCVDTKSDANNCGGCGKVCGGAKSCVQGSCACASGPVAFSSVLPILVDNCTNAGCHSGTVPKEGLNLTSTKAYAELVDVKAAQCSDGRLLVSTSGTGKSYLLQKLMGQDMCSGTKMPKADSSLPASNLALIQGWICNGAAP